ncbi:MAG TPA: hypothetical protein PKM63_20580 [Panacibacter sp.]|nr:hypothetical protein [Panacibacter sp.]HNP46705.1 hypothetical protein [Panacibacter sp.]
MKINFYKAARLLSIVLVTLAADSSHAQNKVVDSTGLFQVSNPKKGVAFRHDTYIAFDSKNNSYSFEMSSNDNYGYLFVKEGSKTRKVNLLPFISKVYPKTPMPTDTLFHALGSITVDKKDRVYLIFYFYYPYEEGLKKFKARIPLLLYSNDQAHSFTAFKLAGEPDMAFLEKKSPFETNDLPPLIGFTKSTNVKVSPMADINVFGIYEPLLDAGGALTELRQQVVTNYSPGLAIHTGGESFASTAGNTTYIAYNEIPEKKEGNTIVILNYDRLTHKYGKQQRIPLAIASKFPYPDAHVTPVIVTLGNGQQHVLVGPQAGDCYDYTRKLSEDAATDTFALAATLKGPRVYTMAMKDKDDNIYVFFSAYKPKPGLYFQKFNPQHGWGEEQLLASPPKDFSAKTKDNYGIYYFKAAMDYSSKVYVSFTFWNTYTKDMYPRFMFQSNDRGAKWKLEQ